MILEKSWSGSAYSFMNSPIGRMDHRQAYHQEVNCNGWRCRWFYGVSVSIYSNTACSGASRDDVGVNSDQGSACVFQKPPGTFYLDICRQRLQQQTGHPVLISGSQRGENQEMCLVGAYRRNGVDGTPDQGLHICYRQHHPVLSGALMTTTDNLPAFLVFCWRIWKGSHYRTYGKTITPAGLAFWIIQ